MVDVVLDTNVVVAGLQSRRGASFQLLKRIDEGTFRINLSVPLVLEYEEVLKRRSRQLGLTHRDIDAVLDYLCTVGVHRSIFFLWRPMLRDPRDDMVLELAVEAQCEAIVTFNRRDFAPATGFAIRLLTPGAMLQTLGGTR